MLRWGGLGGDDVWGEGEGILLVCREKYLGVVRTRYGMEW